MGEKDKEQVKGASSTVQPESKFDQIISKIGSYLHQESLAVSDDLKKVFGSNVSQAFAHAAVAVLQTEVGKLASAVVAQLEQVTPAMNGATKRAQAFDKLSSFFKSQEQEVAPAVLNLLIEIAVQALKDGIKLP